MDPLDVEASNTFAISYNKRVLTVITNGLTRYAVRFDAGVAYSNQMTLFGTALDTQFADVTIYHEFMSMHYLQHCTDIFTMVPPPPNKVCVGPVLRAMMDSTSLDTSGTATVKSN